MSGSTTTTVTNWRVLPKNADKKEVNEILSDHETWSEPQWKESLELYDRFMACDDSYVAPLIQDALCVLDHAYRLYGPESVICSYNGGKDAVVILHLVRAAHAHYYQTQKELGKETIQPIRPRVVYFDHPDEFEEILTLLKETVSEYDLDMVAFEHGTSFSDGLKTVIDQHKSPMAFILGTRTTDPNAGSQGQFAPSSHWMPPFMRINPVLDWCYGHVWHFLRLYQLPYCPLYDQGYTSLGTTKDTLPCPALAVAGSSSEKAGVPKYWPAYMLRDWDQERAGRIKKEKKKSAASKAPTPSPASAKDNNMSSTASQKSQAISTITDLGAAEAKVPVSSVQTVPMSGPMSADTGLDDESQSVLSFISDDGIQRSVGLLIIGNEILKGMTTDTNTLAAAKALWQQNVPLTKVVVVSDDPDEIVAEINRLQRDVDVIITSGGVGPTHDDVTIKSVAAALNEEMVLDDEMAQLLVEKMNEGDDTTLSEAQIKMATLPANAKLRYLSDNKNDWPTLQCRNIFILPGVPQFFSKKIEALSVYLSSQLERSVTYKVVLSIAEESIVDTLNRVVERHSYVSFGSYPFVDHPAVKTVVTLEGRIVRDANNWMRNSTIFLDPDALAEQRFSKEQMDYNVQVALDDLIEALPGESILRVDNNTGVLFS